MIAVGVPWQHEHVPTRFMIDLLRSDLIGDSVVIFGNVGDTDANRNQIVNLALAAGVEAIYFLDVDQGIPTDLRERLAGHGELIVSALAPKRSGEHWLAYQQNAEGRFVPHTPKNRLDRVDAIGFGCVRVDIEVFHRLHPPWFVNSYSDTGNMTLEHDMAFCTKAREAGYEIWVDTTLVSPHYRTVAVKEVGNVQT